MENEIMALKKINVRRSNPEDPYGIPPLIFSELVANHHGEEMLAYISNRYSVTLEDYIIQNKIYESQIFEIVIQLFNIIGDIHNTRFTYNDLKPENIMLSF